MMRYTGLLCLLGICVDDKNYSQDGRKWVAVQTNYTILIKEYILEIVIYRRYIICIVSYLL